MRLTTIPHFFLFGVSSILSFTSFESSIDISKFNLGSGLPNFFVNDFVFLFIFIETPAPLKADREWDGHTPSIRHSVPSGIGDMW